MVTQLGLHDQFNKEVDWSAFKKVPKILVLAGKPAGEEAKKWGIYLQNKFNSGYMPSPDHLRSLNPNEKVKVIAVATLPDVPGVFKGLFRAGFRREAKEMGMILDFDQRLSRAFEFNDEIKVPRIVVAAAGVEDPTDRHLMFNGNSDDETVRAMVEVAVNNYLRESQAAAQKPAP